MSALLSGFDNCTLKTAALKYYLNIFNGISSFRDVHNLHVYANKYANKFTDF